MAGRFISQTSLQPLAFSSQFSCTLFQVVILSGAETSRSEVAAESKAPYTFSLSEDASGNSPDAARFHLERSTRLFTLTVLTCVYYYPPPLIVCNHGFMGS